MSWWRRKKEPLFYGELTKSQFDKRVSGNVIGIIWRPEDMVDISEDVVNDELRTHKHKAFVVNGAYVNQIPLVCLYYEYVDGISEYHMIFAQKVKADLIVGNSFSEEDLIYATKDNKHLTEQAQHQMIAITHAGMEDQFAL
jgi:hypothetical protein